MRARLRNTWDNATSSLWFLPLVLVTLAVALAGLTLWGDERDPAAGGLRPWLFGGTASAARDLLAVVAGSMITVVTLAFSITIVAIQQASTQFSPRVIRNFTRDRGNQVVFGSYIATFTYALLILRQIREGENGSGEFIPALSVTTALLLALACVGLLIYFVHHTATSLQVATIADNIRQEVRDGIGRLYPDRLGTHLDREAPRPPPSPPGPPTVVVRAPLAGFLVAVDAAQLLASLPPSNAQARVYPQVGDYVIAGAPLLDLWTDAPSDPAQLAAQLARAFALDRGRTFAQDILFGVRQLTDIALKALSPGINDPTTAEHCLAHLGDIIAALADRRFPEPWRLVPESGALLLVNRPDFAAIVDAAFGQIRREAADDVHVTAYLLGVLAQIAPRARAPERAAALRHQVDAVLQALERQPFIASDAALVRDRARAVYDALPPSGLPRDSAEIATPDGATETAR
jgi:uncharacterized membrane protein